LELNQPQPSSEYGYFITKKIKGNINKVTKFIEKPKEAKAKQVIKQKGYWNSGMFFLRKIQLSITLKNISQQFIETALRL
jgi:mannose-1-phosphate guanylyltransferase/mannose-6-phosphate isomerase